LYTSPNTIWVTKSGKRRAGLVAYTSMAEKKNTPTFTAAHPGVIRQLGVDGRIILEWILKGWKDEEWTNLAHGTDKLWAFVITIMNFWFPENAGNFRNG
jgi:hypothetical protein